MDLHHIRYFLAVSETLNFTRAAERCNVTQPALSRAIQQLEDEIGGLLFRRERNLSHLTDLGALLRPRFQGIMDDVTKVKDDARRFLTLEDANVTLGVMCTIGPTRFMGLLADLSIREPGLRIHLVEGVPGVLAERLEAGELDVAIMAAPQGLPDRLNVHSLYRERFVVAFPVGHRFEAMRSIPVSAVEGESYLRRVNCEFRDHLAGLCEERGFHVNLAYASEREDWIQNMVVGGLGICFIPEFSAVAPGILTRPVVDPEVWRNVSLVSMAGRRFSPAVATFIKAVTAYRWADGASPHVRIAA